ncbi:terminal nucleotidyltransferase 4A [Pelomyxa schiedti]|nr:terminal nucleotidyltransferase 4A [Pelomyxa schiedti]
MQLNESFSFLKVNQQHARVRATTASQTEAGRRVVLLGDLCVQQPQIRVRLVEASLYFCMPKKTSLHTLSESHSAPSSPITVTSHDPHDLQSAPPRHRTNSHSKSGSGNSPSVPLVTPPTSPAQNSPSKKNSPRFQAPVGDSNWDRTKDEPHPQQPSSPAQVPHMPHPHLDHHTHPKSPPSPASKTTGSPRSQRINIPSPQRRSSPPVNSPPINSPPNSFSLNSPPTNSPLNSPPNSLSLHTLTNSQNILSPRAAKSQTTTSFSPTQNMPPTSPLASPINSPCPSPPILLHTPSASTPPILASGEILGSLSQQHHNEIQKEKSPQAQPPPSNSLLQQQNSSKLDCPAPLAVSLEKEGAPLAVQPTQPGVTQQMPATPTSIDAGTHTSAELAQSTPSGEAIAAPAESAVTLNTGDRVSVSVHYSRRGFGETSATFYGGSNSYHAQQYQRHPSGPNQRLVPGHTVYSTTSNSPMEEIDTRGTDTENDAQTSHQQRPHSHPSQKLHYHMYVNTGAYSPVLGPMSSGSGWFGGGSEPPWMQPPTRHSQEITLHDEILLFEKFMEPFTEEKTLREELISRIKTIVNQIWSTAKIEVYGSSVTSLFLPFADVDIAVYIESEGNIHAIQYLQQLAAFLYQQQARLFFADISVFPNAKVPIIKMKDRISGLTVDICCNVNAGPNNTRVIMGFVKKMPYLRPLVLFLKYFLHQQHLSETHKGGIGSYALTLMMVYILLQHKQPKIHESPVVQIPSSPDALHENQPPEASTANQQHPAEEPFVAPNLGQVLLEFFYFYGITFDYFKHGISVRDNGSIFDKGARGWVRPNNPFLLCVEDPNDPENDVGRMSYSTIHIRGVFAQTYHRLCAHETKPTPNAPQPERSTVSLAAADDKSPVTDGSQAKSTTTTTPTLAPTPTPTLLTTETIASSGVPPPLTSATALSSTSILKRILHPDPDLLAFRNGVVQNFYFWVSAFSIPAPPPAVQSHPTTESSNPDTSNNSSNNNKNTLLQQQQQQQQNPASPQATTAPPQSYLYSLGGPVSTLDNWGYHQQMRSLQPQQSYYKPPSSRHPPGGAGGGFTSTPHQPTVMIHRTHSSTTTTNPNATKPIITTTTTTTTTTTHHPNNNSVNTNTSNNVTNPARRNPESSAPRKPRSNRKATKSTTQ